ncbi:MAG: hypothetical protein VXW32_02835 [Myxococcota bacterium]|nr:hypothetical protein [Myxococcota bacterium]
MGSSSISTTRTSLLAVGVALLAVLHVACGGDTLSDESDDTSPGPVEETADSSPATELPDYVDVDVTVTVDGQLLPGITLIQGGSSEHWTTGPDGSATVEIDTTIEGSWVLHASHPDARIWAFEFSNPPERQITIELNRFDTSDNLDYLFQDPGTPTINDNTTYCSHCHRSMVEDWFQSPHRTAASNPVLQDVYAGTALNINSEEDCTAEGGKWWLGREPGSSETIAKCYMGEGALPNYNAHCGEDSSCDGEATNTGECADCHAPGIDGELGGRDLHDAVGISYDYGVHCDVCHKVESVFTEGGPGVAGKLRILRPTESGPPGLDPLPLAFGPQADVANPKMGAVHRDHFLTAEFCSGCHEHDTQLHPTDSPIDTQKWPNGLPIQSTYSEWLDGPYSPGAPCQSCHMPPDAEAGNGVDIQYDPEVQGIASGWFRPAGSIRKHAWYGPRQPESQMLQLAASVDVHERYPDPNGNLAVDVTVKNVGAGHAIPTGEALRSLVLQVEAFCDQNPLQAVGGDTIPDFGGSYSSKTSTEDWSVWPGAQVGQVVRVVRQTGDWHDYPGVGLVRDWSAEDKGMPVFHAAGQSQIVGMDQDAPVFDPPLPAGDLAFLGDAQPIAHEGSAPALAGSSGFAFARVMEAPDGRRHVHHSSANDMASDNRIMPQESWTTTHEFAATCETPRVRAVLSHRAYPLDLARERNWDLRDSVMVEVSP